MSLLESFGSFAYTKKVLENHLAGIVEEIDKMKLGKNSKLQRVLENILERLDTEAFFDCTD